MNKPYKNFHEFKLQWHLTVRCQMRCKHCYLYDEDTYKKELENELDLDTCIKIMDDFQVFCNKLKINPGISFTGGDPLLRDDFFDILSEANKRNFNLSILGNSYLIDSEMAKKLKDNGIKSYQLSLDGMEETHDYFRKKGSFNDIVRAIKELQKVGIQTRVQMTLSNQNMNDLLPLMDFVGELGVDIFSFGRFSPVGEGKNNKDWMIEPLEYRKLLIKVDEKIKELENRGYKTKYGKKCYLFSALLNHEYGNIEAPNVEGDTIYTGCSLGIHGLIILANGEVHACRRFPSSVGKVPEQSLYDIFIKSPKINEYRDHSKLQKCSKCELFKICRGCPAVSYGACGDWTAPDPQCWKEIENYTTLD